MKSKIKQHLNKKRYGHHHKRSKAYHHVYLPYLPMVIILLISFMVSGYRPHGGILAYASEMSHSGLLSATNAQRASNGSGALTLNSQLNSAAQAKANDMIARNYWSHNTPDGEEPWVFFDDVGYAYTKAGENLAYGFASSSDTVTGWMNSPSHKANLLDTTFLDVGFGFANGNNYNSSGQMTVVVAMYGRPQVLSSTAQASPPPAAPAPAQQPKSSPAPVPAPVETLESAAEPDTSLAHDESPAPAETPSLPITTASDPIVVAAAPTRNISRIEQLVQGQISWAVAAVSMMTLIAVALMIFKHGLLLRHLLRDSERLILHHPLFDTTIISLVVLGLTLLRTVGAVK